MSGDYDAIFSQAGQQYGVDPSLLKAVAQTESSGNPKAVSRDASGNPVAHGLMQFTPATAQAMGLSDPYDPNQAIPAAARLLKQNLDASDGDPKAALMMYHGGPNQSNWGPKTQAYPNTVLDNQARAVRQNIANSDPAYQFLIGGGNTPSQGATTQTNNAAASSNSAYQFLMSDDKATTPAVKPTLSSATSSGQALGDALGIDADKIAGGPTEAIKELAGAATHFATGVGATAYGGYKALGKLLTGSSVKEALDSAHQAQNDYTFQGTPGTAANRGAQAFDSSANPLNWIGAAGNAVGDKVGDMTNSPVAAGAANVGVNALGMLLGAKGIGKTVGASTDLKSVLANGVVDNGPIGRAPVATGDAATPAKTPSGPYGSNTSQESLKFASANDVGPAPAGALPLDVQNQRAAILQRIGLGGNDDLVRESAIEGDGNKAMTDLNTSRFTSEAGNLMKSRLEIEKSALQNHAENIVQNTGGTLGTDGSALYSRGNTIAAPLDALKSWFDSSTKQLYDQARERAQNTPISLDGVNKTLAQKSNFTGNTDTLQLQKGVIDRMQELGMTDKDGNIQPSTVDQSENLRQYLNEQWTPKNSKAIGRLKDSIDDAVTSQAGDDIFAKARQLRALRATTLDDPKGIAKIMDSSGPEGINRAVPTEKIPDAITGMPVDQLSHIVDTLKNVPDELQPQAQAALSEIKAQFANKALDAGTGIKQAWGASQVSQYLKTNTQKLKVVFADDPQALEKLGDLNDAGHILSIDQKYPGAGPQSVNILKSGMMKGPQYAGGAIGASVGGAALGPAVGIPLGAAIGQQLGARVTNRLTSASEVKAARNRLVPLSSFLDSSKP